MKSIILMRHGKSSWKYNLRDEERPLKQRAFTDIELIVEQLIKKDIKVDYFFSSNAKRAYLTAELLIRGIGYSENILKISPLLYDFSGENVLDFIKKLPVEKNNIMIFGHNPAFTFLCNKLGDIYIDNLPTSGLVKLDFKIDNWQNINTGKTSLILTPKDLR